MPTGSIVSAAAGALLLIFGYIRWTSVESMLVRGMDGSDALGLGLFIAGGMLLGFGLLFGMLNVKPSASVSIKCEKCSGANDPADSICRYCGHALPQAMVAAETPINQESAAGPSVAEQIERLSALRQSGALSEQEYEKAKAKLLS